MLKGTKIYLRAIEPTDVEFILEIENNTANWRISNTQVPFSKALIMEYVANAQDVYGLKQVRFIICLRSNNARIGTIDLFDFEPLHQRAGVGILIVDKYQGNGFGYNALELLEEYALNSLGIRNLFCNILEDNIKSHQLFLKKGFKCVGTKKKWFNDKGTWLDEVLYQKMLA